MAADEDIFAEAMRKVQPLSPSRRVAKEAPKTEKRVSIAKPHRTVEIKRAKPQSTPQTTDDPWRLVANGVSRERLKQLASGRPSVDSTIDLHGATRDEAISMLARVVEEMLAAGKRVLCIIHGRGLHSPDKPILKEAAYRWLRDGAYASHVLAVVPEPGSGGGACLVLLRKQ